MAGYMQIFLVSGKFTAREKYLKGQSQFAQSGYIVTQDHSVLLHSTPRTDHNVQLVHRMKRSRSAVQYLEIQCLLKSSICCTQQSNSWWWSLTRWQTAARYIVTDLKSSASIWKSTLVQAQYEYLNLAEFFPRRSCCCTVKSYYSEFMLFWGRVTMSESELLSSIRRFCLQSYVLWSEDLRDCQTSGHFTTSLSKRNCWMTNDLDQNAAIWCVLLEHCFVSWPTLFRFCLTKCLHRISSATKDQGWLVELKSQNKDPFSVLRLTEVYASHDQLLHMKFFSWAHPSQVKDFHCQKVFHLEETVCHEIYSSSRRVAFITCGIVFSDSATGSGCKFLLPHVFVLPA